MKQADNKAIWPHNLIDEILGDNYVGSPYDGIVTSDQKRALEYVIKNFLSAREQEMLLARYRDGDKLDKIEHRYRLTSERVRPKIADALRKLRHPSSKRLVELGYYGSKIDEEEIKLQARELALAQRRKMLEEQEEIVKTREEQL